MDDKEMVLQFSEWIRKQTDPAYEIRIISDDKTDYVTETAAAHVEFFHLEYEIVSFTIDSPKSEEPLFFLHFELKDMDHARQLFNEMIQSLKQAHEKVTTKILLSCSSGFTTSFFADKLQTAAETVGLDYSFSAVSYTDLFEAAQDQDAVLLAPQIGYLLKKVQEIYPDKLVFQIPTNVFATYNASRMLDILKEELAKQEKDAEVIEDIHDPEWDSCIAILALLKRSGKYVIDYRCADQETALDRGSVVKETIDIHDFEDALDVLFAKYPQIKGAAIVTPGTVTEGRLTLPQAKIYDYDIVGEFTKKYHRTFILCNDANAAAVGYYANHRECGNLLAYYHPAGNAAGGAGVVLNGNLHIGKNDIAGEVVNYMKLLNFSEDRFDLARTPEGIIELVTKVVMPLICAIGPDTLAVYNDFITDTDELKQSIMKYLPERHIPEIRKMRSDLWELYYGAGVLIYNLLHGAIRYREDLKEYRQ